AFAPLGVAIGNLLAAGAFAVVSKLPREQFMSWGWRLPFLLSIILVLVGLYIRYRVMETPVFREAVAVVPWLPGKTQWSNRSAASRAVSLCCLAHASQRTDSAIC